MSSAMRIAALLLVVVVCLCSHCPAASAARSEGGSGSGGLVDKRAAAPPQLFCGGAGYNVSGSAVDLFYTDVSMYNYWLHPCGSIASPPCNGSGLELCQVQLNSGEVYGVATYVNTTAAWSAIAGGVQMIQQNGEICPATGQPRDAIIKFLCDASAASPQLSSVKENPVCLYTAVIHTSQACHTTNVSSSSSTGAHRLSSTGRAKAGEAENHAAATSATATADSHSRSSSSSSSSTSSGRKAQ